MAANDALAELAKKPPAVKAGILAAVLVVFGLLYWQLYYSSMEEELKGVQAQHKTLQTENTRLKKDLDKWEDLVLQKDRLDARLKNNKISLPASSELPAFFLHLQKQAAASGVTIKKWKRGSESPVETYIRVPVDIEIRGTFYQVNKYFHLLYQTERPVSVVNLKFDSVEGLGDRLELGVKFTAVTFRLADRPPEAAKPDPAAADKSDKKKSLTDKAKDAKKRRTKDLNKAAGGGKTPEATPASGGAKGTAKP